MLLIIAVLASLSAAFLLFRYAKRRPEPPVHKTISTEPPPNARPLFAPTDEELRRETDEKAARSIARREYRAKAKVRESIDAALLDWR